MKIKSLFYLGCFLAASFAAPTIDAGPHRNGRGGNHIASRPARSGGSARQFVGGNRVSHAWNGQRSSGQHWNGGNGQRRWSGQRFAGNRNWSGQHSSGQHWNNNHWSNSWNWHHHHHHNNNVVFAFGFPFWGWSGYPYYYDYYPYDYGYYSSGYYGSGAYGSYGYNYGNGYGYDNGYGNGYGNGYSGGYDAKVAELQRRLANAGYYRGEVDGIFGSRTQYALKAYRHDHPNGNDNNNYGGHSPTLRDRPYSPPPVTTEPTE